MTHHGAGAGCWSDRAAGRRAAGGRVGLRRRRPAGAVAAGRTVRWVLGHRRSAVAGLVVPVVGPHDLRAHVAGHLLLGMVAPLLLVTPRRSRWRCGRCRGRAPALARLLRSRPVAVLTHPAVAAAARHRRAVAAVPDRPARRRAAGAACTPTCCWPATCSRSRWSAATRRRTARARRARGGARGGRRRARRARQAGLRAPRPPGSRRRRPRPRACSCTTAARPCTSSCSCCWAGVGGRAAARTGAGVGRTARYGLPIRGPVRGSRPGGDRLSTRGATPMPPVERTDDELGIPPRRASGRATTAVSFG